MRRPPFVAAAILQAALAQAALTPPVLAQAPTARPHNVVLFIADGLRFRMVDDNTAPTMAAMARHGVALRNGHSLFPTFTMANASRSDRTFRRANHLNRRRDRHAERHSAVGGSD
jgi:membrane-anchored protein YejM (alkaline phosphatase superfamily)